MSSVTTDVLVIGGGATGVGAALDFALRGLRVILVEKGDLTHGTTGRYHGLLHSGGRYVTKDPQSAAECASENRILRRILPHAIEDTSGFFVVTPWDDEAYAAPFVAACRQTGVAVQEIGAAEMLRREPLLNPRISRVFEVPDASADSFLATQSVALAARNLGAEIRTYHHVVALERRADRLLGAVVEDLRSGERLTIHAAAVLNAAGAWAGKIAALAGLQVSVVPGKGTMIAMNHRMVNTVVNRCKPPADGDILVPIHTVAVIGTTDVHVPDPDVFGIEPEEIDFMLAEGEKLVPGFARYRALRAWAGVRPLYKDHDVTSDRDLPRTFKLLDHARRDGVSGFYSIVGGKWTTYRLMAEQAVDVIARDLGVERPCRTADEVLPPPAFEHQPTGQARHYWLGKALHTVEHAAEQRELICECELVTRERVEAAIASGAQNLDDIRRDVRMGMGPCQGGWCIYRSAALLYAARRDDGLSAANSQSAVLHFLQERWKGLVPVLWEDQLRQARLDQMIYANLLGAPLLAGQARPGAGLVTDHPAIATEYE